MKILLADDHPLVREGIKLLLLRLDQCADIVEAHDYLHALRCADEHEDLQLIILDRSMPGMDGSGGLRAVRERLPDTPVVVLSASEDPEHVREALECGARGYISKSCAREIMLSAMRLVLSGGTYLPPTLLQRRGTAPPAAAGGDAASAQPELTTRQLEVFALLIQGKTNKMIARILDISEATVRTHINAIFKALKVNNRTEAVHVATRSGLINKARKYSSVV